MKGCLIEPYLVIFRIYEQAKKKIEAGLTISLAYNVLRLIGQRSQHPIFRSTPSCILDAVREGLAYNVASISANILTKIGLFWDCDWDCCRKSLC